MYSQQIIRSRKTDAGIVEQVFFHPKADKNESKHYCRAVRIGLSWPKIGRPGSFVIVGQQHDIGGFPTNTLEFQMEYQLNEISLDTLFNVLTESYTLYGAEIIYFDFDEADCLQAFQGYVSESHTMIDYIDVPFKANPFASVAGVKDQIKRNLLKLPRNCEVREQALQIQPKDLEHDDWEKRFPLVPALCHVVNGFLKFPPSLPLRMPGMNFNDLSSDGGWMIT